MSTDEPDAMQQCYRKWVFALPTILPLRSLVHCEARRFKFVQEVVQQVAIELYLHERCVTFWKTNTRETGMSLLPFVQYVTMELANGNSDALSINSKRPFNTNPLADRKTFATQSGEVKPKHFTTVAPVKFKPLFEFELLWYAIVAKLALLNSSLHDRISEGRLSTTSAVHNQGLDAVSAGKITGFGMADILHRYWCIVTHVDIMATLDHACRLHRFEENIREKFAIAKDLASIEVEQFLKIQSKLRMKGLNGLDILTTCNGLRLDVGEMRPHSIFSWLKARIEQVQHKQTGGMASIPKIDVDADLMGQECICPRHCQCRSYCHTDPDHCFCSTDNSIEQEKHRSAIEELVRKLSPEGVPLQSPKTAEMHGVDRQMGVEQTSKGLSRGVWLKPSGFVVPINQSQRQRLSLLTETLKPPDREAFADVLARLRGLSLSPNYADDFDKTICITSMADGDQPSDLEILRYQTKLAEAEQGDKIVVGEAIDTDFPPTNTLCLPPALHTSTSVISTPKLASVASDFTKLTPSQQDQLIAHVIQRRAELTASAADEHRFSKRRHPSTGPRPPPTPLTGKIGWGLGDRILSRPRDADTQISASHIRRHPYAAVSLTAKKNRMAKIYRDISAKMKRGQKSPKAGDRRHDQVIG